MKGTVKKLLIIIISLHMSLGVYVNSIFANEEEGTVVSSVESIESNGDNEAVESELNEGVVGEDNEESTDEDNTETMDEAEVSNDNKTDDVQVQPEEDAQVLDAKISPVKDTVHYRAAGSFEEEIPGLFNVKAEYGENTFSISTNKFSVKSNLNSNLIAKAKEKMIANSGKSADEIVVKDIKGIDIDFYNYTIKEQPANGNKVKIALTRKDGYKPEGNEYYDLLHFNGIEMEKVDFEVDEKGVITFTTDSFSPFYLGLLGSPKAPIIQNLQLPVDSPQLNHLGQDGEGIYHYNINPGMDGVFNITVPKEAFHGDDFKLQVNLPVGMTFAKDGLKDLKNKGEVKTVEYDSEKLNAVIITFKASPDATDDLSTALAYHTNLFDMTVQDMSDAIEKGFEKYTIHFKLIDKNGQLMGENTRYKVRPKTGNQIKLDANSIFDSKAVNISISNDVNGSGIIFDNYLNNIGDLAKFTIPTVGEDDNQLIRLQQVKIYRPSGMENAVQPKNILIKYNGGSRGGNYKKFNDIPLVDGKGTYDIFELDEGKDTLTNTLPRYQGLEYNRNSIEGIHCYWEFKKGVILPENKLFEAANTELMFEAEGGKKIKKEVTGTKLKTPNEVVNDQFHVAPRAQYNKNSTAIKTVLPGHQYTNQKFVDIHNEFYQLGLVMSEGAFTETYHFPYELQPFKFNWPEYSYQRERRTIEKMTIKICKADGGEIEKAIDEKVFQYGLNIDFNQYLDSADDKISDMTIVWSKFYNSALDGTNPFTLDYKVSRTHQDGSDVTEGEYIEIGYEASHDKIQGGTYTYNSKVNDDNKFLFVKVGKEGCNEFVEDGTTGTEKVYTFGEKLPKYETVNGGQFMLTGNELDYKTLYKNPTITVKARANNINGIEEPLSFISAFFFNERMKGWKIIYSTYDKSTGIAKTDQEYKIDKLPEGNWNRLYKADMGLSETEYFTSLKFKYDGDFVIDVNKGDYIYNSKYEFRLFTLLIDVERNRSLYNNNEISVTGPLSTRGTIDFDGFFKCDNPCGGIASANPEGVESVKRGSSNAKVSFKPIGEEWTIGPGTFKGDERTVISYQGGIATAEYNGGLHGYGFNPNSGSAISGRLDAKRTDLDVKEENLTERLRMDIKDSIYIELTDSEFDVASVSAENPAPDPFADHMNPAYPVNDNEVSVIEANGKRYLKISSGAEFSHFEKLLTSSNIRGTYLAYDISKINLVAWNGALLGEHHPFGDVYYDISPVLEKYDGSSTSGNRKYTFEGAVADTDNIRGTGDTTTPTLLKVGDMRKFTVKILQHVLNGVQLYPGKNNIVNRNDAVSFLPREKDNLLVSEQVHIPGALNTGDVVVKLPTKGEKTQFTSYDEEGKEITKTKINEFTMKLKGPASTKHASGLGSTDTISYSYSKDGVNYVDESAITTPDEWGNYLYVKMSLIHQPNPGSDANIEINVPVSAEEEKVKAENLHSYVTGNYIFRTGSEELIAKCKSGEFIAKPYEVHGKLWWDKNEDGVFDDNAPVKPINGLEVILKNANNEIIGHTEGDEGYIKEDGSFVIRTNSLSTNYFAEIKLPEDILVTKHTGIGNPTAKATDSDFDRTTHRTAAFSNFDADGKVDKITVGLIKLPKFDDITPMIHVKDNMANANQKAISENKNKPNPEIKYKNYADDILDMNDDGNITPHKTGKVNGLKAIAKNTLGDKKEHKFSAIVYTNVIYNNKAKGTTGDVPTDKTKYYPSKKADGSNAKTDEVEVKNAGSLKKRGYLFVGWNTREDLSGITYKEGDKFSTGALTEDTNLYAVWKKTKHKVTFKQNDVEVIYGSKLDGNPKSQTNMHGKQQTFVYDEADKLIKNDFTLEGYDFVNWNTSSDGKGKSYADEEEVKNLLDEEGANLDLYVQWKPHEYDVEYDTNCIYNKDINGKPLVGADKNTLSGTGIEFIGKTLDTHHVYGILSQLAKPGFSINGYRFVSWNTKADGTGKSYKSEESVKNLTSDDEGKIRLYAQWEPIDNRTNIPKTGDNSNINVYTGLLAISGILLVVMVFLSIRRRENE